MKIGSAVLMLPLILLPAGAAAGAEPDAGDPQKKAQQVVVTATKLETPTEQVGSSISVITAQQIEKMQKTSVYDVLRSVPALDVVRSGGPGGATSVFIRGAKSEHTLVLIDGVEMNDPISTARGFDFTHLSVDNIERIEVLRGPQSTLYGSDAIGGVVNIITRRGGLRTGLSASLEGGSRNSFRGSAGASGGNEWIRYAAGFSRSDTDGISSADADAGNTERDGYENTSLYGTLSVVPSDSLDLDFSLRHIDARGNIDNFLGTGEDDPNSTEEVAQVFFRSQGTLQLFDDVWEAVLGVSLMDHDRYSRNDTDSVHPDDRDTASFEGRRVRFDWQNNFYLHDANTLTFGMETEQETGSSTYDSESAWGPYSSVFSEQSARTTGYYLQDRIALWDSWFTTLGVRWDDNSLFGTETTYRIASAYNIRRTGTAIRGTFGTGFKAPTLYQLYSDYGDVGLMPEQSTGWDFGLEQSLFGDRLAAAATMFHNEFEDMIDFDLDAWTYVNVARAETKGLELFATLEATDSLGARLGYTYTNAKDIDTGRALVRRPKNKFHFALDYGFLRKGTLNLEIVYVGERDDIGGVPLDGYVLLNPALSWRVGDTVEMFGRVENLLDRDYVEVAGYGTPGVSVYGGIRFLFSGR